MARQRIFWLNVQHPMKPIKEVEADIHVCHKMTWAVIEAGKQKRRLLLGASAFFTLASAEKAKIGRLQKIVDTGALRVLQPHLYHSAVEMLKDLKNGTIH